MCAIKLFLLISCTIVTFAQVCWANNCNCDPVDSLCQEKCVTSTNVCLVNCGSDTECYIQCVNDYWPGNTFSDSKGNHTVAGSAKDDKESVQGKLTKGDDEKDVTEKNDAEEDINCTDKDKEVESDDDEEEDEDVNVKEEDPACTDDDDDEEEEKEDATCTDDEDAEGTEYAKEEEDSDEDCTDDEDVEEEEEGSEDDDQVLLDDGCEGAHEVDHEETDQDNDEASPKGNKHHEKEENDEDDDVEQDDEDSDSEDVEQDGTDEDEDSDNENFEQDNNEEEEGSNASENGKEASSKNIDDGNSNFENITQPSIIGSPNESGSPSQTLSDGSTMMASVTESVSEGASIVSTPMSTGLMTDVPILSFSSAEASAVTTHTTVTSQITVSPTPLENNASNLKNGLLYNPVMLLIMLFSSSLFFLA
ncbi:hypothetical protein K501DRAFT_300006 [Backusella circina FSU 941]|nr:hypothetical protein K501DRAFT_300006 [Backusella circina FSU 941]